MRCTPLGDCHVDRRATGRPEGERQSHEQSAQPGNRRPVVRRARRSISQRRRTRPVTVGLRPTRARSDSPLAFATYPGSSRAIHDWRLWIGARTGRGHGVPLDATDHAGRRSIGTSVHADARHETVRLCAAGRPHSGRAQVDARMMDARSNYRPLGRRRCRDRAAGTRDGRRGQPVDRRPRPLRLRRERHRCT